MFRFGIRTYGLIRWSSVVSICTTCFHIQTLSILSSKCTCLLAVTLTNKRKFCPSANQLARLPCKRWELYCYASSPNYEERLLASSCLSVHPYIPRIRMELDYQSTNFDEALDLSSVRKSVIKFKFHYNLTWIKYIYLKTFIHLWKHLPELFLKWVFQTKFVHKITTNLKINAFFPKNRAVYEIMRINVVEPGRSQMTT